MNRLSFFLYSAFILLTSALVSPWLGTYDYSPANPLKYPQGSPEKCLASMISAIRNDDLAYLLNHLIAPEYLKTRLTKREYYKLLIANRIRYKTSMSTLLTAENNYLIIKNNPLIRLANLRLSPNQVRTQLQQKQNQLNARNSTLYHTMLISFSTMIENINQFELRQEKGETPIFHRAVKGEHLIQQHGRWFFHGEVNDHWHSTKVTSGVTRTAKKPIKPPNTARQDPPQPTSR